MNTNDLPTASLLDIIFEGRNKEYGAYRLRKDYNKRLKTSMLLTISLVALTIVIYSFKKPKEEINFIPNGLDTITYRLAAVEKEQEAIPPPPKPIAPPPQAASKQFTTPLIVNEKDVLPGEAPPEIDKLTDVKIDVFSKDGVAGDPTFIPPQGASNGVIAGINELRKETDTIFRRVEIESAYPGGPKAWGRFLNKNFIYPQDAVNNEIEGVVIVEFVVDVNGELSDINAISGPEELTREAARVIKKSGKWNPAIQNGRKVKSYKKQPVSFKLSRE